MQTKRSLNDNATSQAIIVINKINNKQIPMNKITLTDESKWKRNFK